MCGANVQITNRGYIAVCPYCNTKQEIPSMDKKAKTYKEGTFSVDALIERSFVLIKEGNFAKADDLCDQVFKHDAHNAEAYLCKLLIEYKAKDLDQLASSNNTFDNSVNYQQIMKYGDELLLERVSACHQKNQENVRKLEEKKSEIRNAIPKAKRKKDFVRIEETLDSIKDDPDYVSLKSDLIDRRKKRKRIRIIKCIAIPILVFFAIRLIGQNFFTEFKGTLMEPTLYDGDVLFISRFSESQLYDVILYHNNSGANRIGRIVATPGDEIKIDSGKLYINGKKLRSVKGQGDMIFKVNSELVNSNTLKLQHYFVLPDQRKTNEFSDNEELNKYISRYCVDKKDIVGPIYNILFPSEHSGSLAGVE